MIPTETWWLWLRFMEGGWEVIGQTQDFEVVKEWDVFIDAKEERTGIDHEWTVLITVPYGARPVPTS
jgi:hypothetical protein